MGAIGTIMSDSGFGMVIGMAVSGFDAAGSATFGLDDEAVDTRATDTGRRKMGGE